jgi:MSHA biogenesis protein MshO
MGGRYRAQDIVPVPTDNTSLRFDAADNSFNMLGINTALPADQRIQNGDLVAVYNLGIDGASAYAGNNTATVNGVAVSPANANETRISLSPSLKFPLESPTRRFHVIPVDEKVVSYRCSGTSLYRQANYAYHATTACNTPLATTTPVIATQATCSFSYDNSDMRNGLVKLSLTFSNAGESVSIYHEVHVNNTP